MPSPRAELRARRGYTPEHIQALLGGHDYFGAWQYGQPTTVPARHRDGWDEGTAAEDRMRQAVAEMGETLLAEWIERHPGTRPWFWWRFVAPEQRRCIAGTPRYERPEYASVPHRYRHGLPSLAVGPDWGHGDEYETQLAYLLRQDLLTDRERELLAESPAPQSAAADAVSNEAR